MGLRCTNYCSSNDLRGTDYCTNVCCAGLCSTHVLSVLFSTSVWCAIGRLHLCKLADDDDGSSNDLRGSNYCSSNDLRGTNYCSSNDLCGSNYCTNVCCAGLYSPYVLPDLFSS